MTIIGTFNDVYRRPAPVFGLQPDPVFTRLVIGKGLGGRALDLGAGDGRNSLFLAAHGFTVDAIDLSSAAVRRLKESAGQRRLDIRPRVRDLCQPGVITGQYDVIVADTVLCHLPERRVRRLSGEIGAALKPGAWLYVSVFGCDDPQESEFAALVKTYFNTETLCDVFPGLRYERCDEVRVVDTCHGPCHRHVLVRLIAQKENTCQ